MQRHLAMAIVSGSLTIGALTWKARSQRRHGKRDGNHRDGNHVAGTFNFTAQGIVASTTPATRQISAGTFDVTF
jgi:hypothetical protein